MKILNPYKRSRFFLLINITGLAIGLAVSIMLTLFVVNELSYDKHFENHKRIVSLITVCNDFGELEYFPKNVREAYTELPEKIPGIEAATQIYDYSPVEVIHKRERFQNLECLFVDPGFFDIFSIKFVEGTAAALNNPGSVVITARQAGIIFGGANQAMGQILSIDNMDCAVAAVVEEFPENTHFSFDILVSLSILDDMGFDSLEFYTYYLISSKASLREVSGIIVKEYNPILEAHEFPGGTHGAVEKLDDIYLRSVADFNLGKRNDMNFIWRLSILAILILSIAITNFINMFVAQGETRMVEIGVRKTNGADMADIIRLFYKEITAIVFIAFLLGMILSGIFLPFLSEFKGKDIYMAQLLNLNSILSVIFLFVLTVVLSAFYPSYYLSRFTPLDILGKRIRFSRHRLIAIILVFQSLIAVVLISFVMIIGKQTSYLRNLPIGYNPKRVMIISANTLPGNYDAIKQVLYSVPGVETVSGGHLDIGGGYNGGGVSLLDGTDYSVNEYRVIPGLMELMEIELTEGEYFKEGSSDSIGKIILNESAVRMLGLNRPVVGQRIDKGLTEIIGVTKDFYYDALESKVQPLIFRKIDSPSRIYIKYGENITRTEIRKAVQDALKDMDTDYVINPRWSEDLYNKKFSIIKTQSRIVLAGSLLAIFIAMLGIVTVHLFTTVRRTKEIGIRRINGATTTNIFILLFNDIIKWILFAGIIAMPVSYFISYQWLANYANRIEPDWTLFILPVLIQCIIAFIVTSGISIRVLLRNPAESLKSE